MQIRFLFICSLLISIVELHGQPFTVRGVVMDESSGDVLPEAIIAVPGTYISADAEGRFSFSVDTLPVTLTVSYLGYQSYPLFVRGVDTIFRIALIPNNTLPTVKITSPKQADYTGMSIATLSKERIQALPALLGEADPLKAIQLLPGISTGIEGTSNLLIRGGSSDQTHFLIEEATIYNINHVGGFLSAVPLAVTDRIEVFKGTPPARYGGRLGGIVNVALQDQSTVRPAGSLTIGTATIGGQIATSLKRPEDNILLSVRTAYPALALHLAQGKNYQRGLKGEYLNALIGDLMARVNYSLGKLRVTGLVFCSGDHLIDQDEIITEGTLPQRNIDLIDLGWTNKVIGLKLQSNWNKPWSWQSWTGYLNYSYRLKDERYLWEAAADVARRAEAALSGAKIRDLTNRTLFKYFKITNLILSGGWELTHRRLGSSLEFQERIRGELVRQNAIAPSAGGIESALFADAQIQWSATWRSSLGLRYSSWAVSGWQDAGPELRLGIEGQILPLLTVFASAGNRRQMLHLLTTDGAGLPNELWVGATAAAPPQRAQDVSVGLKGTFLKERYSWQIEAYYRKMDRLIQLNVREQEFYTIQGDWEKLVAAGGRGIASGLEFFLQKNSGKFTGFLAYTLSKSTRQFPDLSNGQSFTYQFDRPHDLALLLSYRLGRKVTLSGNWIYQSGRAVTLPVANTGTHFIFDQLNNGRFPAYHRLDIGLNYQWISKKHSNRRHLLSLSIYNAYNQRNIYAYEFYPTSSSIVMVDPNGQGGEVIFHSRSLATVGSALFPILPGLSYQKNF
jgi:hypothetical protein